MWMADKMRILEKTAKTIDSSGKFILNGEDYCYVHKGRADLFLSRKKRGEKEASGRLVYFCSVSEGSGFVIFDIPVTHQVTVRCINNSRISLVNREADDYAEVFNPESADSLNELNELNRQMRQFLDAVHNRFEVEINVDYEALMERQGEILKRVVDQIEEAENCFAEKINYISSIDEQEYQKAQKRLNRLFLEKKGELGRGADTAGSSLLEACRLVGRENGIEIEEIAEQEIESAADPLDYLAQKNGFKYRKIFLKAGWYKQDHGSFITLNKEGDPVAVLKNSLKGYTCVNTRTGEKQRVGGKIADSTEEVGYYLYREFPRQAVSFTDLAKFAFLPLNRSILTMIILIGVVAGLLNSFVPVLTGYTLENQIPAREQTGFFQVIFFLFSIGLSALIFNLIRYMITSKFEFRIDMKTQTALWSRLIDLPPSFYRGYSSGEISQKITGFYYMRIVLSDAISETLLGTIFGLFYIVILFMYSSEMALTALGITVINMIVIYIAGYFQMRLGYKRLQSNSKLSGMMLEMFFGVSKIRLSGSEKKVFSRWSHYYEKKKKDQIEEAEIHNFSTIYIHMMTIVSSIIIYLLAYSNTSLSMGGFVAFTSAFASFQEILAQMSHTTISLSYAYSLLKNIKPILDEIPEKTDVKDDPGEIKGDVEFSNCSFRYDKNTKLVINDMNLRIEDGEYVAIVGPSGSGKSTLMRLILGFEQTSEGKVYVGGKDLEQVEISRIRQQMGVVLQNSQLLSGDIIMNVAGTNMEISEEEIWQALEKAGIKEDIAALPMKLRTYINDSSSTISGGQKQRLLIARAILKNPKIILFDEATSALDNYTQKIVTDTLKGMDATRIVIAHRLSTVKECDRICVLDKGRIVETGSYEELMGKEGFFHDLVKRQIV